MRAVAGLTFVLAAAMSAQHAHASQPAYSGAYGRCIARSDGATPAMLDCIHAEYDLHDARLNRAYTVAPAALPPSRRIALKTAQRAWIAFRDAECDLLGTPDLGQSGRLIASECRLRMTAERAPALEALRDDSRTLYGD